jgi:hypothetical protein
MEEAHHRAWMLEQLSSGGPVASAVLSLVAAGGSIRSFPDTTIAPGEAPPTPTTDPDEELAR